MIIEACVETLEEALYAQQQGAQQIELCARLDLDGLTPERDLIWEVQEKTDLKIKVMIRPRGGNFSYSPEEIAVMKEDILWCHARGITDIVLGVLTKNKEIDFSNLKSLAAIEPSLSITFHKAIDSVKNPLLAVQQLGAIPNIDYILSSGQQATAWEGRVLLKKMQEVAGENLQIIIAGKVTPANIDQLKEATGAKYYHGRRIV